ncbi:MAG: ATP-binding protein [Fermentimonas sp.]
MLRQIQPYVVLFSALLISLWCTRLFAQKNIHVQPLGPEQGLSQSSVLTIHQDSLGFIWIGTRDGLNEYSGNTVKVYKHVLGDSLSLGGNQINDIENSSDHNLWIAHNRGISLYERKKGAFKNYEVGQIPNNEIRSISIIDGQVCASGWKGVYIYDHEKDAFVKPEFDVKKAYLLDASVAKIVPSPNKHEYWIASSTRGLIYCNVQEKVIKELSSDSGGITLEAKERVEDILFHPNGCMYVATYNNGLYECDLSGKPLRQWSSSRTGSYRSIYNNIRSLTIDNNGHIWIGSFQGVGILNPETGVITDVNILHGSVSIDNASIRSLMRDNNGSIWIGTYHDGLLLYDDYFSRFNIHYLPSKESFGSHNIVSAFTKKNDRFIVGSENGNVIVYDKDFRVTEQYSLHGKSNENVVIKSLYYDSTNDVLWIGTLRNGLYMLRNGQVHALGHADVSVINAIVRESENKLWLLSDRGNGINLYNIATRSIEAFHTSDAVHEVVKKSRAKHLLRVDTDTYLLSTVGSGLICFENKPNGKVKRVLPEITDVNHTLIQHDTLYVSTAGNGIILLNKNLEPIGSYTTWDGLLNNTVFNTMSVKGRLWINSINGITSHSPEEGFVSYQVFNGFPLSEINEGAYLQTENGLLFGGKNAWVSFAPENVYKNRYKSSIFISDIKVNNAPISTIPRFNDIDILHPEKIVLKHDETTLTFHFAGTNYIMPENNTYRYMLEGFEENWRYSTHDGRAEYSKIPPGRYLFKAEAGNNDGVWSDQLTVPITVKPPIWLTWQAGLVYLLLLFGIALLIRNNALKKAEMRHDFQLKELERAQIEQMHNLKVKYFTDISHEIRTPLMLILNPVEEMLEESSLVPKDRKKMSRILYHGKSLLQLVNQLLEINRIELKKEKLHETPVFLRFFFDNVNQSFSSMAGNNQIYWRVDASGVTEKALVIDRDKLEKAVLNLLSNAFKYTSPGGSVTLKASTGYNDKSGKHTLYIEVSDTGIGIEKEDLPHIFNRFYKGDNQKVQGTGIGLSLVKTIVEDLMNGEITVESEKGVGSKFSITIPDRAVDETATSEATSREFTLSTDLTLTLDPYREEEPVLVQGGARKKQNILLVEDNVSLLHSLSKNLGKSFHVYAVTSAEEGRDILQEEDIDLVISDIMLPGISGTDFCAEIKSDIVTSHIPVVLLTAIQQEEVKMESLGLGADDYIVKPFSQKELRLRAMNILNRQEQLRKLYKQQALPEKEETRFNRFDNDLIKRINELVEQNLANTQYSVEDLSADVGLSRVHLYRKLKKLMDVSPSRYVRDYRLSRAAEILSKEDTRVVEVADRVGFQDANYFIKCFKKKFGISPKKYADGY